MIEKVAGILKIVYDFQREFQNSWQFLQRSSEKLFDSSKKLPDPQKRWRKVSKLQKNTENMLKLVIESKKTYKKQLDI